jgi:predicted nucleic acid-binding protein
LSIYADSSVFVSLYLRDAHFADAKARMHPGTQLWLSPLHRVEWNHAIAQHVFRGLISDREAVQFYADFEADVQNGLWLEMEMPDTTFKTAIDLARKHVPRLGCRTLDTLHVASALELGADEFWSFDTRQLTLARAVGLKAS